MPVSLLVRIPPKVARVLFLWSLVRAFATNPSRDHLGAAFAVSCKFLWEFGSPWEAAHSPLIGLSGAPKGVTIGGGASKRQGPLFEVFVFF